MSVYYITFSNPASAFNTSCIPYIPDDICKNYVCDGKEGFITFEGVFHTGEHVNAEDGTSWVPQQIDMCVRHREKEPYKTVQINENVSEVFYNMIETFEYRIEIYQRIVHECTDRYSEMDDARFYMDLQTIYFRVLE